MTLHDDSFQQDMEEIRSFIDEVNAARAEVIAETEKMRAANRGQEEELAEARRRGAFGKDWQVLQQRVDLNRTTVSDIMNGLDHSVEAKAVRALASENLNLVRAAYAEQANDPVGPLAGDLEKLRQTQEKLAETLQAARNVLNNVP